jgi:hypothetical protein
LSVSGTTLDDLVGSVTSFAYRTGRVFDELATDLHKWDQEFESIFLQRRVRRNFRLILARMFPAQPFTLDLGDVVWTVTEGAPENVKHRDTIDIEITGVGTLSNPGMCDDIYRGPADLEEVQRVLCEQSDMVLRFEAKRAELLRALVRDAVEFAVSDSRPGPHHPVGGLVGHRARMMARV